MPGRASEALISRLFAAADVVIDGDRPGDVQVLDDRFYAAVLSRGSLGFGESYLRGWWRAGDVEEVTYRLCRAGLHRMARLLPLHLAALLAATFVNQQSRDRSAMVVRRHYDLGNDLFCAFLGSYKSYSCGYFAGTSSLDRAQLAKLDLICERLRLTASDHLLDVGGGWGEFARHAATHYGCRVTSINISDEQLHYARDLCRGLPVDVRKCDYRELTGTYDKIAAIAMLTHVGPKNYRRFMRTMYDCIAPGGGMLLETIGSRFSKRNLEPWTDRYIFPGAVIPSARQLDAAMKGLFERTETVEFGAHYVPTLRAWHANLMASWPALASHYPETTRLMLEYYLLSSASAFRIGHLRYWHIVAEAV
jgi:cyclopropane-fatty-acyl-phospholipid synthase